MMVLSLIRFEALDKRMPHWGLVQLSFQPAASYFLEL